MEERDITKSSTLQIQVTVDSNKDSSSSSNGTSNFLDDQSPPNENSFLQAGSSNVVRSNSMRTS